MSHNLRKIRNQPKKIQTAVDAKPNNKALACSWTTSPHLLTNGDQSALEMSRRWKCTQGMRMVPKNTMMIIKDIHSHIQ